MSHTVFQINKGINRPIEFKGLKAQYILYFVVGVLALLILFAVLYMLAVNSYLCRAWSGDWPYHTALRDEQQVR